MRRQRSRHRSGDHHPQAGRSCASRAGRWCAHRLPLTAALSALALLSAALLAPPVTAAATYRYSEGARTPLSIASTSGAAVTPLPNDVVPSLPANAVVLSFGLTAVLDSHSPGYGGVPPDPRSLQLLSNGHLLVADRNSSVVGELDPAGNVTWSYSPQDAQGDDPPLVKPFSAQRFTRMGQELTLIVDRNGKRVFVVDAAKRIVWQYGKAMTSGNAVDRLVDPFYAEYVKAPDPANDTILITEDKSVDPADREQRANRVIEVRYADYQAGAPNDGFTQQSIVWQYGSGAEGAGVNQLFKPHSAQRLANGDTLITDADNDRVIGVRSSDYDPSLPDDGYHAAPHPSVVWQYGVTNVQDGGPGQPVAPKYLADPNYAERLPNGHTLIADTGHNRVIDVDPYGDASTLQLDRPNQPVDPGVEPRSVARRERDGALLVADSAKNQVIEAGFTGDGTGITGELRGTATSRILDCGHAQWQKRFFTITWGGDTPAATGLELRYRIDPPLSAAGSSVGRSSAPWRSAGRSGVFRLPAGSVGRTIDYQVRLTTTDRFVTPVFTWVSIEYTHLAAGSGQTQKRPAMPIGSAWMGGPRQAGSSGAGPFAAGSGTGTGSGGGSGGGLGTGNGTGTGSGAYGSAAGTGGSQTVQSSGQAAGAGQVPVQGQTSGATQAVTGQRVGGGPVGGGSQGGRGQAATDQASTVLLWVALAVGVLLLAWSVAATLAERRRRTLVAHDHTVRAMPGGGMPLLKGPR